MADDSDFAYCLASLRDTDRDRYLACLLVPEGRRGAFAALYAFNAEIARVRDLIREPMAGEVRLQWWRELINGAPGEGAAAGPIGAALTATIETCELPREPFERYIEARIFDLYDDPMPDRATFEGYAGETASALMQLCTMVLAPKEEAARAADAAGHAGVALAVAGAILLLPLHTARRQVYVPGEILAATGLDAASFLGGERPEARRNAVEAFADLGREHLARARQELAMLPRDLFPAFLPAAIAGPVLERVTAAGDSLFSHGLTIPQWRRQWWLWRAARRRKL